MPSQSCRRWLRFSLRTLFVAVTICCIGLGVLKARAARRLAFKNEIEAAGGEISCRYQYGDPSYFHGWQDWLSTAMGDPGPMTDVVVPDATMYDRARYIYPEAMIWAYDETGDHQFLGRNRWDEKYSR